MISKDTIQSLIGDWNLISGPEAQGDQFYCEIENWSPLGEDLVETVWFDGSLDNFVYGLFELYNNFDPDEHAALYVNSRGKNGVPESVIDLAKDALDIEEMLEALWEEAKEKIMTTEVEDDDCALEAEI